MTTATDLLSMSRAQLTRLLDEGHAIEPEALDDTEYRGVSLGLPGLVERLTWKKFRKVFHRDPVTHRLRGWNVRLEQNGLDAPDVPLLKRGAEFTFGHYEVCEPGEARAPRALPGLLIDYGRGRNHRLDPVSRLRDPRASSASSAPSRCAAA